MFEVKIGGELNTTWVVGDLNKLLLILLDTMDCGYTFKFYYYIIII